MQDTWMDRLSEYLDGDMDRTERVSIEAHIEKCAECATVLGDLKRVRARTRELGAAPVPADLWARIEAAISQGGATVSSRTPDPSVPRVTRLGHARGGRSFFSLPELLAACLAVAIVTGGTVYALLRHEAPPSKAPITVAKAPEPRTSQALAPERTASPTEREPAHSSAVFVPAARTDLGTVAATPTAETPHEEAISDLRKALMSKRNQLDPATIRTLESNLAIIDLAIDQARRALAADSANTYVKEHLAETMRRKVELLQRATMLASTSNSEGAR